LQKIDSIEIMLAKENGDNPNSTSS
jgi:hypothetical protein